MYIIHIYITLLNGQYQYINLIIIPYDDEKTMKYTRISNIHFII